MKFYWKLKPQIEKLIKSDRLLFSIQEETFNPPLGPEENDFGFGFQYSRIKVQNNDHKGGLD